MGTELNKGTTSKKTPMAHLDPRANLYFFRKQAHVKAKIGVEIACLTQAYNHIPGHKVLTRKKSISGALIKYRE